MFKAYVIRPNVSPEALTAANNLPIFDQAYQRLLVEHETVSVLLSAYLANTEFDQLHRESSMLYEGLQKKQAELESLEAEIKGAVSELDGVRYDCFLPLECHC